MSRIGMAGGDSVLIRYFCPYDDLELCRADTKDIVDLWNQPAKNGDPRRPCRLNMVSNPQTPTMAGSDLKIYWAGNGHVNNGQSDGTCVKVMIGPFKPVPSTDEFTQIPGAECVEYWIFNEKGVEETEGVLTIPENIAPGPYTLFWVWNFTEFWYTSCADIDVLSDDGTRVPTQAPLFEGPDKEIIREYLDNGCSDSPDPPGFCRMYAVFGMHHTAITTTTRTNVKHRHATD